MIGTAHNLASADRWNVSIDLRTKDGWNRQEAYKPRRTADNPSCGLQCLVSDVYNGTPLTRRRHRL